MSECPDGAVLYILFKIEDLGISLCKGLLDSPKHINSQWKTLPMGQVPVVKIYNSKFWLLLHASVRIWTMKIGIRF